MARSTKRTSEQLKARSEYARNARAATTRRMPSPTPFFIVGGAITAVGCALLAWFAVAAFNGETLESLLPTVAPEVSRPALPGSVLLVGGSILFLGEMFRRATWHFRQMALLAGGATTIRVRRVSTGVTLAWMLAPLAAYLLLVPVPVAVEDASSPPTQDFWLLSVIYGFVAAGFIGLFLTSFVRNGAYRLWHPTGVGAGERRWWRVVSVQWRLEHWFGFAAAGFAGILPLSLVRTADSPPVEPQSVGVVIAIAIACAIVSMLLALASPRSGYESGEAESVV